MEKNKKATNDVQKISSRNRNKNKNRNLQIKAKEKELAKKEKLKLEEEEIEVLEVEEEKVICTPAREEVFVVPERESIEDETPGFVNVNVDKFRFVDSEDDNSFNKFNFIESDLENDEGETIEEFLDYNNVETSPQKIKFNEKEIEAVEADLTYIPEITEYVEINARKHISFESRIIGFLVVIVMSFFIAGVLIFKSITQVDSKAIVYDEKSSIEYKVCINENSYNEYYKDSCLEDGMEYLSGITENIPTRFEYDIEFNKSVSTKLNYFVVSKINIYREKDGKVLNTMEEVLVERTNYDVLGDEAEFSISVDTPYKKYVDYVKEYDMQYGLDSYADVEITFHIDNGNVIKEVASISMPLTTKTFSVKEKEIDNEKQNLNLANDNWGSVNTSYAVVGLIFVLFGLIGIIKLTNLVFKVMGSSSIYQRKLNKILKEYDKHIVISRGDYSIDADKKLIKVTTFSELLDARNTLEKPIVYVRVNNIKSEFYVEDSETVYKYTLKEADFEGK